MNPLLARLQPYPCEKLRALLAGVAPPALPPIRLSIGEPVLQTRGPDAGFYLWARVPGKDKAAFARDLSAATHVSVLPGRYLARDAHGVNPGTGFVRIALVPELADCVEAARRIVEFCRLS